MGEQGNPSRLPPLNSLRAFEATARRGSVSAAARELGVTHGAVSHQIRALEETLGSSLFERGSRRMRLTAQGAWSEADEAAWKEECGARVDEEVNAYLNTPVQPVEAMFDYLYADPPPELLQQRAAAIAAEGRA